MHDENFRSNGHRLYQFLISYLIANLANLIDKKQLTCPGWAIVNNGGR